MYTYIQAHLTYTHMHTILIVFLFLCVFLFFYRFSPTARHLSCSRNKLPQELFI